MSVNDALAIVNVKPGPIKVAIINQDENGKGTIDLWEVDGEKFDQEVTFIYPTSDEDWITVKKWVEDNGKKIQTIEVDYSINLCLLLEDIHERRETRCPEEEHHYQYGG